MICKIASQTVARIGEISALRICNILENKIDYSKNWNKDVGLKSTKNRENRTIPILPELYQEILDYIKEENLASNLNNLLFPGNKNDKPYSQKQINKELHIMLEKIGILEEERRKLNIVFHSFRHYGAKHLAENTDRITGMAILGQKTPNLFDRYSNHADKETQAKMEKAIHDSFGKKPTDKIKTIPFPTASNLKQGDIATAG